MGQVNVPAPKPVEVTPAAGETLSPYQFAKKVEAVVENSIRPLLLRDGGDCSIVDIKGNLVYMELHGACKSCSSADVTLKMLVEATLREQVQADIRVIQV
ncbi:MAG: NifU family protein [Thermoguttaceae bacterium]|nr:NifU family protein [Thermoguttaceae bacterium]